MLRVTCYGLRIGGGINSFIGSVHRMAAGTDILNWFAEHLAVHLNDQGKVASNRVKMKK